MWCPASWRHCLRYFLTNKTIFHEQFYQLETCSLGLDRIMSILCKTQSIRDVIAFPKSSSGSDLLFKSPAPVSPEVLKEYGIEPKAVS